MTDPDQILGEQLAYYSARAGEYDEWWERRGRYDRGTEANSQWRTEAAQVEAVLDALGITGDVLELAPGTGYWTQRLAHRAATVTAIDGSAAMIEQARNRLGAAAERVIFLEADLFEWRPGRQWDAVVFCYWISHVPRRRLGRFFDACVDALAPGGVLFCLDGQRTSASTADDHQLPTPGEETMRRRLNDGREYQIVKNFYEPAELEAAAAVAGLDLSVSRTPTYFQYAVGGPTRSAAAAEL